MLAATWTAMSSCKWAEMCSWARTQWCVREGGWDRKDGRARTPMVQTCMWVRMFRSGTGMWARMLRRLWSGERGRNCKEDCESEVWFWLRAHISKGEKRTFYIHSFTSHVDYNSPLLNELHIELWTTLEWKKQKLYISLWKQYSSITMLMEDHSVGR